MTAGSLEPVAAAFCAAHGHSLLGPVGTGAFKETFHIVLSDGGAQALKVYKPGFSADRTEREIAAMQKCSHPNIGRLSAISGFSHGGAQFLLSLEEFLPGGTLSARLSKGPLSIGEARRIGLQLVDAVAHIASHELVHRDLKPDNILFRADGATPVIVDFGLVRDLVEGSLTATWLMQGPGTPFFAPPEQLRNDKDLIDWRADQFSLGVLMSLAVLNLHPYDSGGLPPNQIVERVGQRQPQADQFIGSALAAKLPFLIRMTAPWPVQRFRKPATLAAAWGE
jgi:serine/threonine protein kinase